MIADIEKIRAQAAAKEQELLNKLDSTDKLRVLAFFGQES